MGLIVRTRSGYQRQGSVWEGNHVGWGWEGGGCRKEETSGKPRPEESEIQLDWTDWGSSSLSSRS